MNGQDALGFLQGPTTLEFLKTYLITIAGDPGGSRVQSYYIYQEVGADRFKITFNQLAADPGAHQFSAHSILMVETSAPGFVLGQLNGYTLDGTGPGIMVTGMLNGCSFITKANGAKTSVACAHVRPAAGTLGETLNVNAINGAQFQGNAGNVTVYGRMNYPQTPTAPRSSTVLGVRKAGVWSIYQQQFDADFNIVSATQIL